MKLLTSLFFMLFCSIAFSDVVVIVHPSVGEVSESDIKKIFLGKKHSYTNGSKVTPYYLPEKSEERKIFDPKALSKSSSQLKSYWSKLVFTGKGSPPGEIGTSLDAKVKVATEKDAIAYIDSTKVDDTVKVVATYK